MANFRTARNVRQVAVGTALFIALPCLAAQTNTTDYPQRPVRIVVNVTAGGGVDALARIAAQHFSGVWGQPFVVDNRTGAGGSIGVMTVVKAAPDGYTLLVSSSTFVTHAALHPDQYDPVRDLTAVIRFTENPFIVTVTPSLPATHIRDLISLAKTKPGGLSYASAGMGSSPHMGAALLISLANVPMVHVPYKGVADAYPGVMSGQADWMLGSPISALPLIKAGRLRAIAVTGTTRNRALPDVPTVAESGVPGYSFINWFGMFAPPRVAAAIIAKLNAEAKRALQTPQVTRRMEIDGTDVVGNSPQEFAAEVKAEFGTWRELVQKLGMKAEQ